MREACYTVFYFFAYKAGDPNFLIIKVKYETKFKNKKCTDFKNLDRSALQILFQTFLTATTLCYFQHGTEKI